MQSKDMEKLILEKKDAEQFLSLIAPKYMGVYVLDAKTDYFRDIIGPTYFRQIVKDQGGRFSAAMEIYNEELVQTDFQYRIQRMLNYDYVARQLAEKGAIVTSYRKKDGVLVKLKVLPYSDSEENKNLSIWIFTNEDSADAVYSVLGDARWSAEVYDREVAEIEWNSGAARLLGYTSERELDGISLLNLLHPEDKDRTLQAIHAVLHENKKRLLYDVEHRFQTKSGEYKWFRSVGKPIRDEKGEINHFYGFLMDIQDRKSMELQRERALADALAVAEHANNAKTRFLNNMSHDIRTPMNAIIGFTALAARNLDNQEKVRDYLSKIATSSNHLLSLINDVLDMSRIESGMVKIQEKEVHLPDVFHDLRSILQADIMSKGIDLFFDAVGVTDEDVYCDRLRLNQVLLNLLSNSLKFTNPGGTVSVRVKQNPVKLKGYAEYEIHVKDNGIGMSKEFQKHLFEAFTREQTATVTGVQGTGLGMAITKNIVDMMGGTIEVQSEVGRGTEFIVSLQFRLSSNPPRYSKIKELQGIRALVVDDDMNTCCSISEMLGDIGMRSDWATSGKEAVVRAQFAVNQADEYGVYIVDWAMPDMNGLEAVRRIRKVIGNSAPIIILTAYDWAEVEEEAKACGVTAFCAKPIFLSELREVLATSFKVQDEVVLEEKHHKEFSGRRILLVEDNILNQEVAKELLEGAGLTVDVVGDGDLAVEKMRYAKDGQYDLILMDIQMPRMDGYTATKEIRTLPNPAAANIPIIATTADAFEEDKKAAVRAGMNGHIAKPLDLEKLLALMDEVMK